MLNRHWNYRFRHWFNIDFMQLFIQHNCLPAGIVTTGIMYVYAFISTLLWQFLQVVQFAKIGQLQKIPEACSAEQTLTIFRIRLLLNYSEHCRLEASAREQLRVLALLNRPLLYHGTYVPRRRCGCKTRLGFESGLEVISLFEYVFMQSSKSNLFL
jgi:hypothetical protein